MTVITFNPAREQGFCDQCGQPHLLAVLSIRGMKHRIKICGLCLEKFAVSMKTDPIKKGN